MILDITSFHPDPCLACGSCTSIFTSGKVLCSVCSAGSSSLHRWAGNSNRTWMDQARASFIQFHHVSTRLPPIYGEIGDGSFLFYHVLPTLLEFYLTILLLPMSSRSLKSYAPQAGLHLSHPFRDIASAHSFTRDTLLPGDGRVACRQIAQDQSPGLAVCSIAKNGQHVNWHELAGKP